MKLTKTDSLEDAVNKAEIILDTNRQRIVPARSGIVVYRGGLPGLGKRR